MPKASDTTPSEETTHIIHHHGLHRPSTRLDKTESDETERLVKREERPDQDKLEGTLSQLANERVIPVMADAHNSTNQFYYDTSALKKDEKCRFKGGDDFVDPSKTNRASLAYFGPQHLFKGKQARSQFIRSGAAQGDAFYFPRQDAAHNEEDTRLYNKQQVENAASLRQLNSCPAGERDEPLQQIGSRAQETSDWQAGNKFAVLERTGDSAEGKEAELTIKKSYTPVAPVARAQQQPRRASPQRAPAAPPQERPEGKRADPEDTADAQALEAEVQQVTAAIFDAQEKLRREKEAAEVQRGDAHETRMQMQQEQQMAQMEAMELVARAEEMREAATLAHALAQSRLTAANEQAEGQTLLVANAVSAQIQGITAARAALAASLDGPALEANEEHPAGIPASQVQLTALEQLDVTLAVTARGLDAQEPPAQEAAQGASVAAGQAAVSAIEQADAAGTDIFATMIGNAHGTARSWLASFQRRNQETVSPLEREVAETLERVHLTVNQLSQMKAEYTGLGALADETYGGGPGNIMEVDLDTRMAIDAKEAVIERLEDELRQLQAHRAAKIAALHSPKQQLRFTTPHPAGGHSMRHPPSTTHTGQAQYPQGPNYFSQGKSSYLADGQVEGATKNVTILTMGAKSSAFTRAAARTMDHEEWMELPSKEAYKLWLLCMMEVYTLLEIFLDDKDPSLMAGIAINDGRGLWLRLMRRFFAPDQDKAAAVEKEIRALQQDVGTPQNWETVDELMMRFTALCRKYRQFSRILADGTRHCFQDDKHLQRELLIFRTAPRYKRVVTHIITEENKTKKFNNGIPILWSIDDIRTELRDTEEAERSLHNKLHMRPVIGTTRLPNGKTGTANSAFDMSGYTDVLITDVTDQEAADEANFGEDMERKPVGSFPKGSCKHHPLSTTHDTKMCSKEQNNHGDGGGTDEAQKKKHKKKEFKSLDNKPRLFDNNKNGDPNKETSYFSKEEQRYCNTLVYPDGSKGACWRCGFHFDADRNAKPPVWHKCPPGSTTAAARKNWMRGLRTAMKNGSRKGWLVKSAGSANQAQFDPVALRAMVKEQIQEEIANGVIESKGDEDECVELEQEIYNRMVQLHQQKKVRSAIGLAVQPPDPTCTRPPHNGGAVAHTVAPTNSLSPNVCPTNRSEDAADGPTQTSPTAWPPVETPHAEADSPGRGTAREQGAWADTPGARAQREAEGNTGGVPSSDPRLTSIAEALTNFVPLCQSPGTDRPPLMHAHMAKGVVTDVPRDAIESAGPEAEARRWEWGGGSWKLSAHAASSKTERARWHINTFAQTTAAEAIGHPDTLFVHISSEEHFEKLYHSPVLIDTGELSHLANSAPVRAPSVDSEGNVDASLTQRDLCEAIARLETGKYRRLVVPTSLQNRAMNPKAPGYSKELEQLVREVIEKGHRMPSFYDPKQQASLIAEHRARNQIPEVKPKCAVLCAGVGCDAIAALATHYEVVLLVDVCHHATEELRRRFPNATVLPLDLRDKGHLAVIAKHRVDVVLFGIPCQPSSMCNPHQKPDDVRLKMTALCLTAAISLRPTLMMAENVAGFVLQRPKHFKMVLDTMEQQKYSVSWHITNAKWFGSPTQRLRVFIIGHRFKDNEAIETLTEDIKTQKQAYKDGLKTYRTVHELLSLYRTDMNTYKGVLLHQRRKMGSDDVAPARIVSTKGGKLKGSLPTLTSKMRQSARSLANYKVREIDEADKSKTLVMDKQDFTVCQGCHRTMQWSEARRCHTRCPGCTLPDGGSRGAPGDIQRGNIVNPNQVRFKLERLVRPLARACALQREAVAAAADSPQLRAIKTELDNRMRAAAKRVCARVLATKREQAALARAANAIPSNPPRAIVDSGASGIFVTSEVKLDEARAAPGQLVKVANDHLEPIAEQGLLPGTTLPAKKVDGFARTLVAVGPLTALVGQITFDTERVYAVSTGKLPQGDGGVVGRTPIGSVTADHLYSFNLPALVQHCKQFAHLLPAPNAAAAALLASAKAQTSSDGRDAPAASAEPHASHGGVSHGGVSHGGVRHEDASSGGAEQEPDPDSSPADASSGGAEQDAGEAETGADPAPTDITAVCPVAAAVSDQEASRVLRIFHSTWGHMTGPEMAKLHDSGTDFRRRREPRTDPVDAVLVQGLRVRALRQETVRQAGQEDQAGRGPQVRRAHPGGHHRAARRSEVHQVH